MAPHGGVDDAFVLPEIPVHQDGVVLGDPAFLELLREVPVRLVGLG